MLYCCVGTRLKTDNVFNFLIKLNKDWRYVGEEILRISNTKLDEIGRQSPDDDKVALRTAINFWLMRCVYASWRWIIMYALDWYGLDIEEDILNYAEPLLGKNIRLLIQFTPDALNARAKVTVFCLCVCVPESASTRI